MKFFLVLIAGFISFIAFSTDFSEDKKTNEILKNFFNGDYYGCTYSKSYSSGYDSFPSGFLNNPRKFFEDFEINMRGRDIHVSRSIQLIKTKNKIGVIFEKPITRWTIVHEPISMVYEKTDSKEYNLCGKFILEYWKKDDDNEYIWDQRDCDKSWNLIFDGNNLSIKPQLTFMTDYYVCDKVNLSYTEKVYLVRQIQTTKK